MSRIDNLSHRSQNIEAGYKLCKGGGLVHKTLLMFDDLWAKIIPFAVKFIIS